MAEEEKKTKRKHTKSEIGSEHGSTYFNGRMTDEEYLSELKFPKGSKVYDKMRRSDPTVSAVLQSVFNPIKSATWTVVPASESTKDKEIAEFVSTNLFPEADKKNEPTNKSWKETLHEILLYIIYGFSVMEKVYTYYDGKIWVKKLSARLPRTITEFVYKPNSNDFDYAVQEVNSHRFELKSNRIMIFTANKEGATLSGISYLRSAYKPYTIKNDLQRIQASTYERYGMGTPMGVLPEGVSEQDPEGEALIEALENISSNELSYMCVPNGTEVEMLSGGAQTAPDMQDAINYCDTQITFSFLAQFINLGTTTFGSRALGNTFVDFFTNSLEGVGDYIAGKMNQDLIQELVDLNYPDVEEYPQLQMSRIDSVDLDNIALLSDAGLITSTYETEVELRRIFRLPPITEEQYMANRASKEGNDPEDGSHDPENPDSDTAGKEKRGKNPEGKGPNGSKVNKKDAKKQLSSKIRDHLERRKHALDDQ